MAANEIAERLAAACWVECGQDGDSVNELDPTRIRYRSLVGFQQRIIMPTDPVALPVLILPLDRTLNRNECAVIACRHATSGQDGGGSPRITYPDLNTVQVSVPQVFVQPMLLEWMGPDLTAPTFFPFGITNGAIPQAPPVGSNLDLFDAIAVLLPVPVADASSGDFSILVLKHPPREGDTIIQAVLPTPP